MHVYCKHGFGSHTRGSSFVSLDDLDNISILLEEENDIENEITHLFNEASIFIFKFEKNTTNQAQNILKTCTTIRGTFEQFQDVF